MKYVSFSHNHRDHNQGGKIYKKLGAKFITHSPSAENMSPNENVVVSDSIWVGDKNIFKSGEKSVGQ